VLAIALSVCVILFTAGSLLAVGLTVTPAGLAGPLRDRAFLLRTAVAGWILGPAIALVLVGLIPIDRPYAAALLLLSLAPGAPFAPAMMQRALADPAYIAAFMALTAVGTVVLMPLGVPLLIQGVSADPLALARPLVLLVLLPLVAGVMVRHFAPGRAHDLQQPIGIVTTVTGVALLLIVIVLYGRGVVDAVGSFAIATQIAFVMLVTLGAHAIGAGLVHEQRTALTVGMCSRNLGAALAPLAAVDADPRALVMVVIAAPVTVVLSHFVARWLAPPVPARHAGLT
jgi:BASS family bile acid:Na+ symporter